MTKYSDGLHYMACIRLDLTGRLLYMQVEVNSSAALLRKRYREMAIVLHPDKCKTEGASEAFQKLVSAYKNLLKYAH